MEKRVIVVIILVIILGSLVSYRILKLNKKSAANSNKQPTNQPEVKINEEELKAQYEAEVREILAPFWAAESSAGIKEQLLELTVPYIYKDLHLELVIAFSMIDLGQAEGDQEKVEEGIKRLDELVEEYKWLVN